LFGEAGFCGWERSKADVELGVGDFDAERCEGLEVRDLG
jgi:hypothetical protein